MSKITIGTAVLLLMLTGCVLPPLEEIEEDEAETELAPAWLPTGEELTLLAFVNDGTQTTVERLDVDCAIRSDSAAYIVEHRDGDDGLPITADDDPFETLKELDQVHMVGPWTIEQLVECAVYFGYEQG